jgi:enoyl-CoA hydratase/3-hydroxyacyl-CoA dehydrogenase
MAKARGRALALSGVVGGGTMGAEIALVLARTGTPVVLCDVSPDALARAQERIRAELDRQVARGSAGPAERDACLARLSVSTELPALVGCDLVVEAVFEDLGVKRAVFAKLDAICPHPAILATNTSSFLVAELADGLAHPERVVGLHFFYPASRNRLVEVVAGPRSDPKKVRRALDAMAAADKIAIRVADAPGFCVNRFFVPWLNEAVRIRDGGGHDCADIDAVAREVFGCAMGPFAIMNATGVAIAYHAASGLAERLGNAYAPARGLTAQFESGRAWDLEQTDGRPYSPDVAERLLGAVWHEANALVAAGVCGRAEVNLGARVGLRWKLGPFELLERTPPAEARAAQLAFLRRYPAVADPSRA